jgi:hypothetical protein
MEKMALSIGEGDNDIYTRERWHKYAKKVILIYIADDISTE